MRKLAVVGGLAALVFSGTLAFAVRGPHIEMKESQYDFGRVTAGTTAEHVFEIKNSGDAVLIIQKVQPS